MKLIKNQRGQGLIEYLILVALMGVATIGIIRILNGSVQAQFANVINAIQGSRSQARMPTLRDTDYQKKDFGTFMNGTASRSEREGTGP